MMPGCNVFISEWVPGMQPLHIPLEAGFIWGTGDTSIVLFQAHYHNMLLKKDLDQASNMTITFTPKL
jgi:hypothetical protein